MNFFDKLRFLFGPDRKAELEKLGFDIDGLVTFKEGLYSVYGTVNFTLEAKRLPANFYEVTGDFICSYNGLNTLAGSPVIVGGDFYCSGNNLTDLNGCPNEIHGTLYCGHNPLKSGEGLKKVFGRIDSDLDLSAYAIPTIN
jgi:hypothetical protein